MQLTLLAALSAAALLQNVICLEELPAEGGYFGKSLGPLSEHHHAVKGQVYAVDSRTLHIRHFSYDGEGPGAYFFVGTSKAPNGDGTKLRDEKGRRKVLRKYNDEHITLTLPEGKTLSSIKWFSVWCEDFSVNFGDVRIPKNFDAPKPQKLEFLSGIHGVSSDPVVIVDSQTFLVPNFSYDGEAPDAKFWVGSGEKPTSQGTKVADENGRFEPLKKYDRKTLVITLPGNLTVQEIGHFGIWCEAFAVDFAHVKVPSTASVPPSLRMLGVSPQKAKNEAEIFAKYPELREFTQLVPQVAHRRSAAFLHEAVPTTFRPPLSLYHPPASTVALDAHPEVQQVQVLYLPPQQQQYQQDSQQLVSQQQYVQQPLAHFYPHPQQAYYLGQQTQAAANAPSDPVYPSQQPNQYYYNY